eukprot:3718903-Rhodomonas_salina.1
MAGSAGMLSAFGHAWCRRSVGRYTEVCVWCYQGGSSLGLRARGGGREGARGARQGERKTERREGKHSLREG